MLSDTSGTDISGLIRHPDGCARCWWAGADPVYVAYHDTEWGVPERDGRALYEKLILDGFQAGLSWITILRRREGFRRAFAGFDPQAIARFTQADVERLMQDTGIIRNRAKIVGTIAGARAYLAIEARGPGFSDFLWDFVDGVPIQGQARDRTGIATETEVSRKLSKALKAEGFTFCGPTIVHAFMQAVGLVNDHLVGCHRHAPCAALGDRAVGGGSMNVDRTRAWQRMLSGRRLDLLDPSPRDVEIADIAHGLARVARWNGQTAGSHVFSVAQHALLVEAVGGGLMGALAGGPDPALRVELLLHDAPEYVIGDIISPLKAAIGDSYKGVELRLMAAIRARFALPEPGPTQTALVKRADGIAAYHEAVRLAGFSREEANAVFGACEALAPEAEALLAPWPTDLVQARFLARFHALTGPDFA